jgi:hypothetical protein
MGEEGSASKSSGEATALEEGNRTRVDTRQTPIQRMQSISALQAQPQKERN